MARKRQPEDGKEGNSTGGEKRQRGASLRSVMLEAVKMHDVQKILEPLVRKIVKEELEVALRKYLTGIKQNCIGQVHQSTSRSLQLQFTNKLSLPVFTGTRLEAEDCSTIRLAIMDTLSGQVVDSGPESLAKVEIVVLEGDFGGDEQENWSIEEFSNNIVKEREGKRPLLTGDAFLNLSEGTGVVGDVIFTDNSSWTRSRKFRLGARVVDGNCDGITVKEAKTEPFMVKDHRGELYKKHYPPSLVDEVWRLEKIGKDGAFHKRLRSQNINTVKDFLTLLCMDTPRLRNILGNGMSAKMWEVTVDHARTCILDNRKYMYYPPSAQKRVGVVFNSVGQVLGILAEEKYVSIDELSDTEKADAHKLVQVAYEHREQVVSYEDGAPMGNFFPSPAVCFPSSSPGVDSSYSNQLTSNQKLDDLGFNQCVFSPDVSSILPVGGPSRLNHYTLQGTSDMDLRYEQPSNTFSETMLHTFCEDNLQYFDTEDASQADLHCAVSGFLAMSARSAAAAQMHWRILYSVLKWIFTVRRIVASKKRK
ncbi:calmodulin-binding protein 60 A-like isoform X2 [Macadamia integrifolia]|uniref:calmodulin-binding protein 60 A-like isoform X2 n=1 Tax=Macadamia integrifolia TaxID=60698 RepID=UPI001C4ECBC9|nr:calmodulin-binding protein 60 A-like isoform X2 [Macadamia integrifolia]XP_042497500.1 calmodulin-binding protein 60 A-like isoform X2 [Macadamia integrifolia]